MAFVLLLDQKASASKDVYCWLKGNGFVTSLAFDVLDALEELSDFTVRNRPDCVLLEVPLLAQSFDGMRFTLRSSSGSSEITVLGLTHGSTTKRQYFANSFAQLHALIGAGKASAAGV